MTRLEAADKIEGIVGAPRHLTLHLARAVSAEQRVYIMHSHECCAEQTDLPRVPVLGIDVKHLVVQVPLPVAWDGRAVKWDRWEAAQVVQLCPPPKAERCSCGSTTARFTARGRRDPSRERIDAAARMPTLHTRGRPLVWSVYDLFASRCPDCGEVSVYDMAADEHWTLDESDLGPTGSWAWSGGLLDALLTEPGAAQ